MFLRLIYVDFKVIKFGRIPMEMKKAQYFKVSSKPQTKATFLLEKSINGITSILHVKTDPNGNIN